jgi:uncharacterized membrane protein
MPNIHPLLVHFPIALIFAVIVIDLIGFFRKNEAFLRAGTIITLFAAAGAIAAVVSGLLAEESVWHSEAAEEIIEKHELLAFIYLGLIVLLAIVKLAANRKPLGPIGLAGLVIAVVAAGVVSFGGYLGGELVYSHGTGVTGMQQRLESGSEDDSTAYEDEEELDEEEEAEGSEESE